MSLLKRQDSVHDEFLNAEPKKNSRKKTKVKKKPKKKRKKKPSYNNTPEPVQTQRNTFGAIPLSRSNSSIDPPNVSAFRPQTPSAAVGQEEITELERKQQREYEKIIRQKIGKLNAQKLRTLEKFVKWINESFPGNTISIIHAREQAIYWYTDIEHGYPFLRRKIRRTVEKTGRDLRDQITFFTAALTRIMLESLGLDSLEDKQLSMPEFCNDMGMRYSQTLDQCVPVDRRPSK